MELIIYKVELKLYNSFVCLIFSLNVTQREIEWFHVIHWFIYDKQIGVTIENSRKFKIWFTLTETLIYTEIRGLSLWSEVKWRQERKGWVNVSVTISGISGVAPSLLWTLSTLDTLFYLFSSLVAFILISIMILFWNICHFFLLFPLRVLG